jgi:2-keto-3-deoxy-L-rhamnonate aldolase RhmA
VSYTFPSVLPGFVSSDRGHRERSPVFKLKEKLQNGDLAVGTMVSELRNPNIVYLLALCGYDYFIIDNEHGAYSPETVSDLISAARGADIAPVVRIPEIRRETILKPLDSGAAGLLVPQVNTAEQAREIIVHAKYPPQGNRGVALRRAHSRYQRVNPSEYLKKANEETFIAVQAETPESIDNLEAIASVPGIDAVFVGPFDLSVALGIPGQVNHPREVENIDRILEVCSRHNLFTGIQLFEASEIKRWVEKGMRFVSYSSDVGLLADAAGSALAEIRTAIKKK